MTLTPLDETTAPETARDALAQARKKYGFLPNLLGNMAHSPALLKAYVAVSTLFEETSLSAAERQVVLLATSVQNACSYCVAAHSAIASMHKVPSEVVTAVREKRPIPDPKLEALRRLVEEIVESRGWPAEITFRRFLGAGYTEAQALDVLLGVGMKTLSNYTNHLAETPLDAAFSPAAWLPPTPSRV